jgi:hypothetical protein
LGRDPIYLPAVRAKNQQRPKTHHSKRFANENASRESRGHSSERLGSEGLAKRRIAIIGIERRKYAEAKEKFCSF